jgi:hypothetical protein
LPARADPTRRVAAPGHRRLSNARRPSHANARRLLDAPQWPAELAQRNYLIPFLFTQDIAHSDGGYAIRLSYVLNTSSVGRFLGDHHWPDLGDRCGNERLGRSGKHS